MASVSLTASMGASFLAAVLAFSHSPFSLTTSGSSAIPFGVLSRGNSSPSRETRAASQFCAAAKGAKLRLARRNFSPYPL